MSVPVSLRAPLCAALNYILGALAGRRAWGQWQGAGEEEKGFVLPVSHHPSSTITPTTPVGARTPGRRPWLLLLLRVLLCFVLALAARSIAIDRRS